MLITIQRRLDIPRALAECARLLRMGVARGAPRSSVPLGVWIGPLDEPLLPMAQIADVPIERPVIVASATWAPTWSLSWLGFATTVARAGRDAQRRDVLSAVTSQTPTASRFVAVFASHERGAQEKRRALYREFGDVVDLSWIALDATLHGQVFVDVPSVLH